MIAVGCIAVLDDRLKVARCAGIDLATYEDDSVFLFTYSGYHDNAYRVIMWFIETKEGWRKIQAREIIVSPRRFD